MIITIEHGPNGNLYCIHEVEETDRTKFRFAFSRITAELIRDGLI